LYFLIVLSWFEIFFKNTTSVAKKIFMKQKYLLVGGDANSSFCLTSNSEELTGFILVAHLFSLKKMMKNFLQKVAVGTAGHHRGCAFHRNSDIRGLARPVVN
jgi:hypothetical protein